MLTGFRAGADSSIGLAKPDDFAGTRRAWGLPAGAAPLGRVFPGTPAFDASTTPDAVVARLDKVSAPVLAAGMWPYPSLKPNVGQAIAGQLDAHFTAIGQWAAGLGVPVHLSMWHEPENDTMGAATTDYMGRASNFVAMHVRAYEHVKEAGGDAVRMGPCHQAFKWDQNMPETAAGAVAGAWRVPDGYRDFVAVDCYTANWNWGLGVTLSTKRDFQRWLTVLAPPPELVLLAERGISRTHSSSGADDQAAAVTSDYGYLKQLGGVGAYGLMYWNSGGMTDNSTVLLGPPGQKAFVAAAVDAVGASPVPGPAADPTKDPKYQAGFAAGRKSTLTALSGWVTTQSAAK